MASDDVLIERLLRVIDEGRRTATYKLALLLALIDTAASLPDQDEMPTRAIAQRVLELYYPQTRSFVDRDGVAHVPRQISMKSSTVLNAVERLRLTGDALSCRSLDEVSDRAPREYRRALDSIEDTFVRYPIPLLQTVGTQVIPFLYEVAWPEGTGVTSLRTRRADVIRLLPGVASRLVVLGPMLRPLIEHYWTQDVAKWTRLGTEDDELHAHLFGRDRASFPKPLVGALRDLQGDACFYCRDRLPKRAEVDHFIPWSRWPNDAIENLVVADRCNGAKSNHLAATTHLLAWRARLATDGDALHHVADVARWPTAAVRSLSLARSTYLHLPVGTPLWVEGRRFEITAGPIWA